MSNCNISLIWFEFNQQVEKPTKDDEDALVGNEEIKEEVGSGYPLPSL